MSAPALRLDKKISSLTYWEKHWRLSGITILNNWWQDDTNPAHLETQKSPNSRHHHHLVHIIAEQFITQRHIRYCHGLIFFLSSLVNYTVHHIGWEKNIFFGFTSCCLNHFTIFCFSLVISLSFSFKKDGFVFACIRFCRIMTSLPSPMHQASLIGQNIIVTTGCSSSHLPLAGPSSPFSLCLTHAPFHSRTLAHNGHARFLSAADTRFSWSAFTLRLPLTRPHFLSLQPCAAVQVLGHEPQPAAQFCSNLQLGLR